MFAIPVEIINSVRVEADVPYDGILLFIYNSDIDRWCLFVRESNYLPLASKLLGVLLNQYSDIARCPVCFVVAFFPA